jgi:hypothetical protein
MELGASRRALTDERPGGESGRESGREAGEESGTRSVESSCDEQSTGQAPQEQSNRGADQPAADPHARANLIDATQYDFERLERAVRLLSEQQQALLAENQALRDQLEDGERRVHRLESELDDSNGRRRKAMERMDALIRELDRLDEGLERSLQTRGGTPAPGSAPRRVAD